MINEPNFFSKSPSPVKTRLNQLMFQIAPFDGEFLLKVRPSCTLYVGYLLHPFFSFFVLTHSPCICSSTRLIGMLFTASYKVALYVRDDLNIRSTANYILALCSTLPSSSAFLKLYLPAVVRLPSDWLDIPALYLCLEARSLQGRSFPASLRKAMAPKFYEARTLPLSLSPSLSLISRFVILLSLCSLCLSRHHEGNKLTSSPPHSSTHTNWQSTTAKRPSSAR